MIRYFVRYQTISQKTKLPTGTMSINVMASSVRDAMEVFKSNDNASMKYKNVSVVKTL